jgi:TPP-dependent pyruvate/acetoin dehydrogenase alpha subunit
MDACTSTFPEHDLSPLELFRRMALLRAFEETRWALWRAGRLAGELFLALGQEASAVGLAAALEAGDSLFPSRRGLVLRLAAGMSAEAALRPGGALVPGQGTPAGHLPIAVGSALAGRLAGGRAVSLAEFGEGASCEGLYHETLRIAMRWQAPVLFALIRNGYGAGSPTHPGTAEAVVAAALGLPVARVDGQDAAQVRESARELLAHVRSRPGPALIECQTYGIAPQLLVAGTSPVESRPASEIDFWRNRDPLRRLQITLLQSGLAHEETLAQVASAVRTEVSRAAQRVFGSTASPRITALAPLPIATRGDRL